MKKSQKLFLLFVIIGVIFTLTFILVVQNNKKNNFRNQTSDSISQERQNYLQKLEQLPNWNLVSETEKENLKKEINNSQSEQLNNVLEQAKKLIKSKGGNPEPSPKPKLPNQTPPPQQPPTNNPYSALVPTKQELEYKFNPPLAISSVGTDYSKLSETNNNSLLPGSALLTDTLDGSGGGSSALNSKGITHIIHAAPWPRDLFKNDEDFINCVVKSVQNSIISADRNNFEKLAIPFVGGGIYLGNCDPQKLAEGIIRGAVNQLEKCKNLKEIILIDWEDDSQHYFLEKIRQLENELFTDVFFLEKDNEFIGPLKSDKSKGIDVQVGDIRSKRLHKASVIVNAANTQVQFGGGISGAIAEQVGDKDKINQKAKELIDKFNSRNKQRGKDNIKRTHGLARFAFCGPTIANDGKSCFLFFFTDGGSKKYIEVSQEHPVFQNPPFFWKIWIEEKQQCRPIKISWKESEKDKKLFQKEDFIEIEEI